MHHHGHIMSYTPNQRQNNAKRLEDVPRRAWAGWAASGQLHEFQVANSTGGCQCKDFKGTEGGVTGCCIA